MASKFRFPRLSRAHAYAAGLVMTAVGLITLFVFVIYECLHAEDLAENVVQVVFTGLGGIALVLLGFSLMVLGSPGLEAESARPEGEADAI